MAVPYQHKRSTTAAAVPTLLDGEMGINQRDGKLFWKDHTGAVQSKSLFSEAETATTVGALINASTAKATPVDADLIGLMDSAASNVLKKLSWANLKATLKTYFDTLYKKELAPVSLTDASTIYTDASLGNVFDVSIAGNRIMAEPTNPVDGKAILYRITQSGSNNLITWNSAFSFGAGSAPTLSTVSGKMDLIGFQRSAAKGKWLCTGFTIGF